MDLDLANRRVLVTGSSSGIGTGIAQEFAAEGALVVVHGRNEERANAVADGIRAAGGQAAVAVGDLSNNEGASAVAQAALAAFGGIDILINNAGGGSEIAEDVSFFKMTPEDLIYTYEANTVAAFRLIQALVPAMRERGWGRVINIASAAGVTPTSAQPDYGPAKAAMINLSLGLSKTLKMTGVTVNCVSPGMTMTENLVSGMLTTFAQKRGWGDDVQRAKDYFVKGTGQTANRPAEVADIAYACVMLASPRADIINGTNFHVDAGISPAIN
ncbi:MAG: SDR family oxidoreductase [Actinomycetota bacterium]|nr:SDR family oxidoreductase [Actinomycetota bacterium]